MIIEPEIKEIYKEIQKKLFYMIPERWDKIYLYSSVIENKNKQEKGEMFFYYFPKSILPKKPVNVYEVPAKFSIDETDYLKLADSLYKQIKKLRKQCIKFGDEPWSNINICIENFKFRVEYDYEDLNYSGFSNYERHLIWRYKYLRIPLESYSKQDKSIIEKYITRDISLKKSRKRLYEEPIYEKPVANIIDYDTDKYKTEQEQSNIGKNKGRSQILNIE